MKKFAPRLIAAVMASTLIVTPVMAAPSIDELKEDKEAVENEVESLQNQLSEIVTKIGQLEEDLIAKGEEITQAEEDLAEAEAIEKKQYEDMKLRIQFMYEEGDKSILETFVSAESFTDIVNMAEYMQNVHTYDREKLDEYVATKEMIAELKVTLENEMAEMEAMQVEYEAEKSSLDTLIETKQAEVADLNEQIQEAVAEAERQAELARQQAAAAGSSGGSTVDSSYVAPGNSSTAQTIVSAAYSQLGVPYVWGGTTPGSALDCSGLVQYCHRRAGISLGRHSSWQTSHGQRVTNPQPGDVVCYVGHVGIYIGGGKMIHAPHTGDVVRVASVYGSPWYRRYW